jgi:hypothetical protein
MPQNATSLKPPAVRAAVALKRAEGKSKAQIAREMRIDRETVTRILGEPAIKEALEASRSRCVALLPKAERAVERQLDTGDGDLGLRLLEKSGALTPPAEPPQQHMGSIHLQQLIQVLLHPPEQTTLSTSPALENSPTEPSRGLVASNRD